MGNQGYGDGNSMGQGLSSLRLNQSLATDLLDFRQIT